jgi:hypothetical protein
MVNEIQTLIEKQNTELANAVFDHVKRTLEMHQHTGTESFKISLHTPNRGALETAVRRVRMMGYDAILQSTGNCHAIGVTWTRKNIASQFS